MCESWGGIDGIDSIWSIRDHANHPNSHDEASIKIDEVSVELASEIFISSLINMSVGTVPIRRLTRFALQY